MERHALRGGFVLAEAAAGLVVVAALAAVLLVLASESRRQSSLGDDLANLTRISTAAAAYSADNADVVFGFSWTAGVDYGFGGVATSNWQAHANQAIEIIRRRTGRVDINPISNWVPHLFYSTLVLADYLDEDLPARWLASPEDRLRLLWQSDPEDGFYALDPTQRPPSLDDGNNVKRWPYSSSYTLAPAFWSADAGNTVYQTVGGPHDYFNVPPDAFTSPRRLSEVAFPGQKAMMYERYQRHFGPRTLYFGYPEARIPVLRADGSAALERSGESNRGFYPPSPLSPQYTLVNYTPDAWEPPTLNGQSAQLVLTHYQWTRSGLRGRDFGGPEIPWTE